MASLEGTQVGGARHFVPAHAQVEQVRLPAQAATARRHAS
jgi:hypothetical protein